MVGLKYNGRTILEPVGSLYPEILTDTESRIPGCGEVIQSAPQRCATNKMAAQLANNIINTLLTEKMILVHQTIFNSRMCGVRPEFISLAQQELFKDTLKEMASLKQTVDRPSVAKRPAKQDDGSNPESDEDELDDDEFDEDELDEDEWDDECEEEDQ
ncbi:hypothetical protein [Paenibacillus sp. Soil724D2]|uniref:hypothetical protein n=1 Tax=Paenibacillus sp. (strain Soil724D2) TaxID=1736392 RepID=UPI000713C0BE|nr:hypothetical protein [Paenibacillus sp. Soil724D2]KRE32915.1 hypothetical protein ASG85_15510 [Paenibacillus sp. Soil724D2]